MPSPLNAQYLGSGWLTSHVSPDHDQRLQPRLRSCHSQTHGPKDAVHQHDIDPAPLRWLGVENQFFTVLLTPGDGPLVIQSGTFQCFNQRDENGNIIPPKAVPDIEAAANFPAVTVPAGQTTTLNYGLYAGPKDFNRLDQLGQNQGELMNYDGFLPFSFLIVPMLTVLKFWYLIFHNYGVAIILLTLMIKAITWPLQSIANRSGKRMQALAPKLKEIQAKYKEQPEKLQTETFAPLQGVRRQSVRRLPAGVRPDARLLQPLLHAPERRRAARAVVPLGPRPDPARCGLDGAVHDLRLAALAPSAADHRHGAACVMMRMTPQMGDPTQAKVAQFMPLFFLFIFYNFAAALSLYYVINNCVSIIQIYRNLKKPLPPLKPLD